MHDVHTDRLRLKSNNQFKCHLIRSWTCKSQNSSKLDLYVAPLISNTTKRLHGYQTLANKNNSNIPRNDSWGLNEL